MNYTVPGAFMPANATSGKPAPALPVPDSDFYLLAELLSESERALVKRVRAFMETKVAPVINKFWAEDAFPFELLPGIAELNIAGVGFEGYGCPGGSTLLDGFIAMEMARVDASIAIKVLPSKLESEYDRLTLCVSRHFKSTYENLVRVFHRGRLMVPCIRGDTLVAADRRFADCAAALVKATNDVLAIGIGLLNQGPSGWALSVDEACNALEFGSPAPSKRSVYLYSEIVVDESARRTDNVLRYLNCLLQRLAEEPDLLTTLQTYFDQLQRRKITADALGIHPNTLNHRLERIETLLGAKLDEPSWIAKLHVAVRLRQQTLPEPE
jgi:hypothetical protein